MDACRKKSLCRRRVMLSEEEFCCRADQCSLELKGERNCFRMNCLMELKWNSIRQQAHKIPDTVLFLLWLPLEFMQKKETSSGFRSFCRSLCARFPPLQRQLFGFRNNRIWCISSHYFFKKSSGADWRWAQKTTLFERRERCWSSAICGKSYVCALDADAQSFVVANFALHVSLR